jgi:hypothetical protein
MIMYNQELIQQEQRQQHFRIQQQQLDNNFSSEKHPSEIRRIIDKYISSFFS